MSKHKKIASIAFTGAATAATLMATGPALAATSVQVHRSGPTGPLYTGVVKGKNTGSASFKDTTTGVNLKCRKAVVSASIAHSHGIPPAKLGHLRKTKTKWSSCTGAPVGFRASLTTSPSLTFTGVSTGDLTRTGIRFTSTTHGGACFDTWSSSNVSQLPWYIRIHVMTFDSGRTPTLTVRSKVGTCFGNINVGDRAYFTGAVQISVPTNLTITS